MTTEKVDTVDALFGGRKIAFKLDPDHGPMPRYSAVASLEMAIGSPYATLQRFGSGIWRATDVGHILRHAYPGARPLMGNADCPEVNEVLRKGRIANYAPLAHKLLEAFLFGLPAAQAVFDERNPFPEQQAA